LLLSSNTRRRLEISLDGGVTGLPFGPENLLGYTYAAVEDRVYIGTNQGLYLASYPLQP
jgi:hypothetical protein